jgi:ElaB/YqjD/DUF883 family membrane-anchored ribosome-binding protein
MAEERYLGTARAPEAPYDDADVTKAELQRRMEEARESITQTVSEIKETVTNQYESVRESISQTLDWREQYRRRPIAFAAGAAGVGLLVGYSVGRAVFGESDFVERYHEAEGADYDITDEGGGSAPRVQTAYAPAAAYPAAVESAPAARPSYSSGYEAQATADEPDKPGLIERFKETQAYDRLQQELGNIGGRVVDELSKTAQQVVLPALLSKLKDLIGLDLLTQREGAQRNRPAQPTSNAQPNASAPAGGQTNAAPSTTGGYGSS